MIRKIIYNSLVSLIMPFVFNFRWLPGLYDAIFNNVYSYYDFQINSVREYFKIVFLFSYLPVTILSLLGIFLPFQLIKDFYWRKGKPLTIKNKIAFLTGIIIFYILVFGSFNNIWTIPWYNNFFYLLFAFIFGILFTLVLYLSIDKYVQKNHKRHSLKLTNVTRN